MNITMHHDEYLLGRYRVRRANFTGLGWDFDGEWLRALVTNRRLVLSSDQPGPDTDAAIAAKDIARVWHVCLGNRDGLIVGLHGGHLLYLFIEWSQGVKLAQDIREMIAPPLQPRIDPRRVHKPNILH